MEGDPCEKKECGDEKADICFHVAFVGFGFNFFSTCQGQYL